MAAPIGNEFWKLAKKPPGSPKKFKSPDDLWSQCCDYFKWVSANPLQAAETVKFQGMSTLTNVPKMRAMSIGALCIFINISVSSWHNYKKDEKHKEFLQVITQVEEMIRTQKFEGASADMLNANIIARDLGMVDKKETDFKGDITYTDKTLSEEEATKELIKRGLPIPKTD